MQTAPCSLQPSSSADGRTQSKAKPQIQARDQAQKSRGAFSPTKRMKPSIAALRDENAENTVNATNGGGNASAARLHAADTATASGHDVSKSPTKRLRRHSPVHARRLPLSPTKRSHRSAGAAAVSAAGSGSDASSEASMYKHRPDDGCGAATGNFSNLGVFGGSRCTAMAPSLSKQVAGERAPRPSPVGNNCTAASSIGTAIWAFNNRSLKIGSTCSGTR